jgi:hypothetical protein
MATKEPSLQDFRSDLAGGNGRAVRFAVVAIALDCILLAGPLAVATLVGHQVRADFPFLKGECLTWSFWAPLTLAAVSTLSILLAFVVPNYSITRGSAAAKLATLARVVAVLVTLGWLITTLVVAYANPTICIE